MTCEVERRLAELGLTLPEPPDPLGNYRAAVAAGNLLYLSGQMPLRDGVMQYRGRLGESVSVRQGRAAAELAALNVLAQVKRRLGGFERLRGLLRVEGVVACTPEFQDHPQVLDGASDLLTRALGARGEHTRAAVGVVNLPGRGALALNVVAQIETETA